MTRFSRKRAIARRSRSRSEMSVQTQVNSGAASIGDADADAALLDAPSAQASVSRLGTAIRFFCSHSQQPTNMSVFTCGVDGPGRAAAAGLRLRPSPWFTPWLASLHAAHTVLPISA